jgi:hypothetical protein
MGRLKLTALTIAVVSHMKMPMEGLCLKRREKLKVY